MYIKYNNVILTLSVVKREELFYKTDEYIFTWNFFNLDDFKRITQ